MDMRRLTHGLVAASGPGRVVATSVIVLAMSAPAAFGDTVAASPAAICATSFDPYTAPDATLAACGVASYPLVATQRLADGGTSYHYNVAGDEAWINIPPAGFDPATADAAGLQLYGIPTDPGQTDAAAHSAWQSMVSSMKFPTAPAALHNVPSFRAADVPSGNWAGQVGKKGGYTSAYAEYTEPAFNTTCAGGMASYWVGLGGWTSANLAQNGTAQGVPGLGSDQAWWEILPTAAVAVPIYGSRTYNFQVKTTRNVSAGTFTFFFYNTFSDLSYSITVSSGLYSGSSAEMIAERVKINGVYKPLQKFGTIHVTLTANNVKVGDPNDKAILKNSASQVLASPTDFDFFSGEHYDINWQRCS